MFCAKNKQFKKITFLTVLAISCWGTLIVFDNGTQNNQLSFGQEQAPPPTPEQSASTPPPARVPGETIPVEIKNAAIESVELPENIPSPTASPAEAASLAQQIEEKIANPVQSETPVPLSKEPVKLENYDPSKSFSQLLFPHIAERVGLSDAQKSEVSRLMTERSQKLGAAPKEEWNAIVLENEAALQAILLPQQLERFKQGQIEKKSFFALVKKIGKTF